jgi:outer membrane protein TolC
MTRLLCFPLLVFAAAAQPITISQTVETSLRNYPSVRVSQEDIAAAAAGIQLARTAYLPRIDTLAQVNRATRNNVFGMLMPQSVIPSMSGPALGLNTFGTAWGSAIGGLVTWEPFDFGLRRANVAAATAVRARSEAALRRTEYDIAVAAADAFLTLAAAQETVRAAQAGVDRAATVAQTIHALADAQLRPGADASRADAELAAARTQLIQSEEAVDVAKTTIARFTGADPAKVTVATGKLAQLPSDRAVAPLDPKANPVAMEQQAVIEQAKSQLHAQERQYFPRFYLQGAAYARGTGAETDGRILGGFNGLGPTTGDLGIGFTVTFPVFDFASLRARENAQSATIRSETARAQQIATDIRAQWNAAVATLNGARRVAANTPVQVKAARDAADQATARYRAGLANVDSVAEAQRLQTQAEIDDALARLAVWRALLAIATAAGDIRPFLAEVGQ